VWYSIHPDFEPARATIMLFKLQRNLPESAVKLLKNPGPTSAFEVAKILSRVQIVTMLVDNEDIDDAREGKFVNKFLLYTCC
jgi:agmatine/peptidylarginine deiminase